MIVTAMGGLGESLAAWLLVPVVVGLVAAGLAMLAERLSGARLAPALLVPVGFATMIVLVMPGYRLGAPAWVAVGITAAGALAGFWLARGDLAQRLRPGPALAAGVATYGLYIAAVVLAGGWTWTGYNFVNDTAVQMLLAEWLAGHGASMPVAPTELGARSTTTESLRIYFATAYPLGAHALLATVATLVPASVAAIYQPLIALTAALGAVALASLARAAGLRPWPAAGAGFLALAANLPFVYGLQGNFKEIVMAASLATAAAVGREALDSPRPVGHTALLALPLAAAISAFSAAAVPFVGAFALVLLVAAGLRSGSPLRRRLLPAAAVGAAVLVVGSAATLVKLLRFGEVAQGTFSGQQVAFDLGHLLRPLELIQTAGIWMVSDYRLPVPAGRELVNHGLIALVVAAALAGLLLAVRRREPAPFLVLVPALLTLAVLSSRTSPYATGKLLMLASPGLVLTAAVGLAWLASRRRLPAALASVAIAGGMLFSDALAYHNVQLAPVDRLRALEELGDRFAGQPRELGRWVLLDEHEEFAKVFMAPAHLNAALEVVTPAPVGNQLTAGLIPRHADVDQMTQEFLARHPVIVQRRGADSSRPPSSYRHEGGDRFYDVWRRDPGVEVRAHLGVQSLFQAQGVPDCAAVEELAAQAEPGDEVVAAVAPAEVRLTYEDATVPRGWPAHSTLPGVLKPATPGTARAELEFPGGRWRVWVFGSFGRDVEVRVDGRAIGAARGVNTAGEWLEAGEGAIDPGRHEVEVVRRSGSLAPGDGYVEALGPVVFQRVEPSRLLRMEPEQAATRVCGRRVDWVELVRR